MTSNLAMSWQPYFKLPSCPNSNRSLSVSVPLTAIAQANWEIKATATVSVEADK